MRKVFLLSVMALLSAMAAAQSVTVKFTGVTTEGAYCQISEVEASDLTHGWNQTLDYPDTTLVLNYSDGIGEKMAESGLAQNSPNPFNGSTESVLTLAKGGMTKVQLVAMNGAVLSEYAADLNQGQYRVGVTMEEVGMAVLNVVTPEGRYAIKLLNMGKSSANGIELNAVQRVEKKSRASKAVGTGVFVLGDTMQYSAVAVYEGVEYESNVVTHPQLEDETVTFVFDIPTEQVPEGAVSGKFSVSDTEQVYFSQGNLQFQASTRQWRFAATQYERIGVDNESVSSTNSGWIDLFCWGTSGWSESGANEYQPYAVSMSSSDYMPGGDEHNNLTGDYANADWGVYNPITNGGNEAGLWRTPSAVEWDYLFNTRSASTVSGVENARFVKGTVADMLGVIIFPDVYSHPADVELPVEINVGDASYGTNTYTANEWQLMEDAGAVFLPAAGYRHNETFYGDTYGSYWSSTAYNVGYSMGIYFEDAFMMTSSENGTYYRASGRSVRLVKTIE